MNLYRVISEELSVVVCIIDAGQGPREFGCIAHLVAAESPAKARWAAWKTDVGRDSFDSFTGRMIDMPRFSCRLVRRDVDLPAGIYSGDARFVDCWEEEAAHA